MLVVRMRRFMMDLDAPENDLPAQSGVLAGVRVQTSSRLL